MRAAEADRHDPGAAPAEPRLGDAELLSAHDQLHETSLGGREGIGTHHVVLAHEVRVEGLEGLPTDEHDGTPGGRIEPGAVYRRAGVSARGARVPAWRPSIRSATQPP